MNMTDVQCFSFQCRDVQSDRSLGVLCTPTQTDTAALKGADRVPNCSFSLKVTCQTCHYNNRDPFNTSGSLTRPHLLTACTPTLL